MERKQSNKSTSKSIEVEGNTVEEAIKKALEIAEPKDTVIITGKGSEIWMCLAGGKKIPWSDREVVKEALAG